jgi:hypothetical protein
MRPLKACFFICLLIRGGFGAAQDIHSWTPVKSIPFQALSFTTDNLGNVYFITRDSGLVKYDTRADTTVTYADYRYGSLGFVDATNPLQLLLFYPDFGTIQLMDRYLSVQNTIDLRSQNIFKPDAIATSNDNRIWVYDEQQAKLKKIDLNGNPVLESVDLRQVLGEVLQPQIILDKDGLVFLSDSSKGIFIFDYYGTYRNELHFTHVSSLQLFNNQLILCRDRQLTSYDLRTLTEKELPVPDPATVLLARVERNQLFVLRKDKLDIYAIQ